MSEFEAATIAYQQAALAIQQTGLWVAFAQIAVGLIQSGLIAGGLWLMWKASKARDNQHQEAKDRHEETMAVLQEQRHAAQEQYRATQEQYHAAQEQYRATQEQHRATMRALEALIERTARD